MIAFFNHVFKTTPVPAIPHSDLRNRLLDYMDDLHVDRPDELVGDADAYLQKWSRENRWLNRFHDAGSNEPIYELTSATEDVLEFLSSVLERPTRFVGTESRLSRILTGLSELVVRGSADRERRLNHLQEERDRIDEEIAALNRGADVVTHSPTAIRERFGDIVSDLHSLQGDFRAVEEAFKEITRTVRVKRSSSKGRRGAILGEVLHEEDAMRADDQGASFEAFAKLILSERRQDELGKMIEMLDELDELSLESDGKDSLRDMVRTLSGEAGKVMATKRRLSETLARLLDARSDPRRQHLASVLSDIRQAAARIAVSDTDIADRLPTLSLSLAPSLWNVFQRTFWTAPTHFDVVDLVNDQPDDEDRLLAFRDLARLEPLAWSRMRRRIDRLVAGNVAVPLRAILEDHVVEHGEPASINSAEALPIGVVNVLGYVQIAHDDGHTINAHVEETFDVIRDGRIVRITTPEILFGCVSAAEVTDAGN